MIKLFGQIRYHWQPELSLAISYWSVALMPFFIALSLIYEKSKNTPLIFGLIGLSLLLVGIGGHRYFILDDQGGLRVVSVNPFSRQVIKISQIARLEVSKYRFCIELADGQKHFFFMRKWPKKYFLDALAVHSDFQGEVELMDNQARLDYFHIYHKKKRP